MKQESKAAAAPAALRNLVRKACSHMGNADAVIAQIHDTYVVPLIKPDGTIDTKSPALMALRKQVRDGRFYKQGLHFQVLKYLRFL